MTSRPTADPVSLTARDIALDDAVTAHNYHPLPVVIASASGAWVTDVDGRRYLDCLAGYSALNFGHGHPRLVEVAREAVAAGLKEAGVDASAVTGIAVAGQQHGLVVLDAAGRPLRPALLWNDTRSAPQAEALTSVYGAEGWAERTGSAPVASLTARVAIEACSSPPLMLCTRPDASDRSTRSSSP